jgi:hypothetical protein
MAMREKRLHEGNLARKCSGRRGLKNWREKMLMPDKNSPSGA